MQTSQPHFGTRPASSKFALRLLWILLLTLTAIPPGEVAAQTVSPITSSGLNTQVNDPIALPNGHLQHDITGGTRVNGNLFHSFGTFSAPTNNVANFANGVSFDLNGNPLSAGLPTSNILARVTTPNPSVIFGSIQTTGFGDANLFLMNPAGIIFGPNASLNVEGSVTFTTANHLHLAELNGTNSGIFNANPASANILTSAPVSAFGFLGPSTGISMQGSRLTVDQGSLTLVGGNEGFRFSNPDNGAQTSVTGGVNLTAGTLSAIGGAIDLVSVASSGEISNTDLTPTAGMAMGNIRLADGSLLNTSGDAGGSIKIRGGSLVIQESTLSANSIAAGGNPTAIDINLSGSLTITNNTVPALLARTTGEGDAGGIRIRAQNFSAVSATDDTTFSLIDTHTSAAGRAGDVTILTESLSARMAGAGAFLIDSGTSAQGSGGNVAINSTTLDLQNANINTGDFRAINSDLPIESITGSGGAIDINSPALSLDATVLASQVFNGHGGDISLVGHNITVNGFSLLSTTGLFGSGAVAVTAHRFAMTEVSQVEALTAHAPGGDVTVTTGQLELSDGSLIRTQTGGRGSAGNITINATDSVTLSGNEASDQPSGLYTNSLAIEGVDPRLLGGDAGTITITTPHLAIIRGARVDTTTQTSGRGGNVTIRATDSITIAGERTFPIPEDVFFSGGSNTAGGIFTRTIGAESCSGACGVGGNISLTARQSISVSDGSMISAASTGPGDAGNIIINAGQTFTATNSHSAVSTQADAASGGTIKLIATDSIQLTNSTISASVSDGSGTGGNITIDPQYVILQNNSQILARAKDGQGGAIAITTNLFLPDATSLVNADSGRPELNGTVTIQSPNAPISGKIQPLSNRPLQITALLNQSCAAVAGGQFSSFTVAGRDNLPLEPGGWLSSPLASTIPRPHDTHDESATNAGSRVKRAEPMRERPLLSLRRIAPPGFLTKAFAAPSSAGCAS
jgi:filamentous hemagglutinin family protein